MARRSEKKKENFEPEGHIWCPALQYRRHVIVCCIWRQVPNFRKQCEASRCFRYRALGRTARPLPADSLQETAENQSGDSRQAR